MEQNTPPILWSKDFILLLITAIFMYLTTFMFTPTLPLVAKSIGIKGAFVGGIIILVYTIGCLISRSLWGELGDHWQKKKVYLIGILILLLSIPFYGIFISLSGILIIRFTQGIGFSASSTSGSAMAADMLPAARLTEGIGYYTLANTLGMAVGPGLGIYLHQHYGSNNLYNMAILCAVISLTIGFFVAGTSKYSIESQPKVSKAKKDSNFLIEKSVLPICLIVFFIIMPYGAIMAYIASFGIEQKVSNIGIYFSVFAITLFIVRLFSGRLSNKYGPTVIILPGVLFMAMGLLILNWASSLLIFVVSAVLFGVGFGVTFPLLQALAYMFCAPSRRGVASATLFATADLAYGFGALILGFEVEYFGYAVSFASLAIFEVLAAALFIKNVNPKI